MRLQKEDLFNFCKHTKEYTDNKYELRPEQKGQFWALIIVSTDNGNSSMLVSGLTLREAYETVRAINRLLMFNGGL